MRILCTTIHIYQHYNEYLKPSEFSFWHRNNTAISTTNANLLLHQSNIAMFYCHQKHFLIICLSTLFWLMLQTKNKVTLLKTHIVDWTQLSLSWWSLKFNTHAEKAVLVFRWTECAWSQSSLFLQFTRLWVRLQLSFITSFLKKIGKKVAGQGSSFARTDCKKAPGTLGLKGGYHAHHRRSSE